jgi:hypothetical protein
MKPAAGAVGWGFGVIEPVLLLRSEAKKRQATK